MFARARSACNRTRTRAILETTDEPSQPLLGLALGPSCVVADSGTDLAQGWPRDTAGRPLKVRLSWRPVSAQCNADRAAAGLLTVVESVRNASAAPDTGIHGTVGHWHGRRNLENSSLDHATRVAEHVARRSLVRRRFCGFLRLLPRGALRVRRGTLRVRSMVDRDHTTCVAECVAL